jgi:hypothetical protein
MKTQNAPGSICKCGEPDCYKNGRAGHYVPSQQHTPVQMVGQLIYALVARMGGKYRDISCLTSYEVTPRGTLRYVTECMPCVANKAQYVAMHRVTAEDGFVRGRPTMAKLLAAIADGTIRNCGGMTADAARAAIAKAEGVR